MLNWETKLPRARLVQGRQQSVVERCRGKRVLHLGCVDAGLLEERFEAGQLMHQKLAAVASDLWGVDVDADGIDFLRSRGFDQLVVADAAGPVPALDGRTFDVIVASEVLEHLLNPGLFLDAVRGWMTPGETELIVTGPNAFRIDTLLSLLRGVEKVHPDHNYWFSYRTATNVLEKSGLEVTDVIMYSLQPHGLLPDVLRRGRHRRERDLPAPGQVPASRPPLARRALAYFTSLPKRALATFLYGRSPFWGDGLILLARRPPER